MKKYTDWFEVAELVMQHRSSVWGCWYLPGTARACALAAVGLSKECAIDAICDVILEREVRGDPAGDPCDEWPVRLAA